MLIQPEANLLQLSAQVGQALQQKKARLSTAESCTGGLIATAMTHHAGSSAWFDSSFVTYSNIAKQRLLGVCPRLLASAGAVSEAVAKAMARGALRQSQVEVSLAVTGIAGPSGATQDKPVGFVCFAWALPHQMIITASQRFSGNRASVRQQSAEFALTQLLQALGH